MTASETEAIGQAEAMEARFRRLEDEERAIATQNALSPEGALAAVRGELSVLQAAGVRDSRDGSHRAQARRRHFPAQWRIGRDLADQRGDSGLDEEVSAFQAGYQKASRRRESDQEAWSAGRGYDGGSPGGGRGRGQGRCAGSGAVRKRRYRIAARSKLLREPWGPGLSSRHPGRAGEGRRRGPGSMGRRSRLPERRSAQGRSRGSRREEGEASLLSPQ